MIHNAYIIRSNGICLWHRKYGSLEEDPQSITAFLTAISMFCKSVIGEQINTITTPNYKFVFKSSKDFSFVIFADNTDTDTYIETLLNLSEKSFHVQFPEAENVCKNGNMTHFEQFNSPITRAVDAVS